MVLPPPDMTEILSLLESAQEKSEALISSYNLSSYPKYALVVIRLERQITDVKRYAEAIHRSARDEQSSGRAHTRR